ncbi:MAG: VOC family protein [Pseudomonadota bacterium]
MRIERIDHVHVEVADRDKAAAWFEDVLGLVRADALADWAAHPLGPLILATPDGLPVLSLFAREAKPASRDATIAFRVSDVDFRGFLDRLDDLGLLHADGRRLTRADVVDHDMAWSIYFMDPWGNRFEITSYDYATIQSGISS